MAGTKRPYDAQDGKASKKTKVAEDSSKKTKLDPEKTKFRKNDVGSPKGGNQAKTGKEKFSSQKSPSSAETFLNGSSSREAHAKQRALAQDRKAAKPNADSIARSKKIWERLRRKSHVPKEERDALVKELFEIITGRVKDFVFKHDSVRVIQCAVKYSTPAQRKQVTQELRGSYRELAESKYAKFLIAKMVVGDDESRDAVVEEFYGHVKRLIRHPEASWIVDDIYRTLATKQQKAVLLREWYGPEFVVFAKSNDKDEQVSADLSEILKEHPEKRSPIMQHLKEMTNHLVQKKTTGFTILHDALLQYFLNCKPGSPEVTEFLDMLRDDEEGDCFKNLAFTKSGSRLVCLALAYGNSKDRRTILKFFKTHIKLLASDTYGHTVLLTAFDVIDDTVMTGKAIFPELLGKDLDEDAREQDLLAQTEHLTSRIPLLYLMSSEAPKWLISDDAAVRIKEVREIRSETSKKDPEVRRLELLKQISQPLLDLIASRARFLARSTFGCQFMAETLFGAVGDKEPALAALASLATEDGESEEDQILSTPAVGRMLKSLVQGGRFDKATNTLKPVDPPLKFHDLLYAQIKAQDAGEAALVDWANGSNSFVVVAMLEAEDFGHKDELLELLRRNAASLNKENTGARIILDKVGGVAEAGSQGTNPEKKAKKNKDTAEDKPKAKKSTKKAK